MEMAMEKRTSALREGTIIRADEERGSAASALLERLLARYAASFDIERDYKIDGYTYDALAAFNVTSARYVLVEKAELWRANCFEYILFNRLKRIEVADVERVLRHVKDHVEPVLVRGGKAYPPKDHMYSYMTAILITDGGVDERAVRKLKKAQMYVNYLFSIRGYSQLRLIAVDTAEAKVVTNKAAKQFIPEIKKLF